MSPAHRPFSRVALAGSSKPYLVGGIVTAFAKLSRELRKLSFKKNAEYRATKFTPRLTIFRKRIDEKRTVDVELWSDGSNLVCHWFKGFCDVAPTFFSTVEEMYKAIEIQSTTTQSAYYDKYATK